MRWERSPFDAALRRSSYAGSMIDFSDLDSADPLKRDLAYLRLLEELLGPEWVERLGHGAREAGGAAGVAVANDI